MYIDTVKIGETEVKMCASASVIPCYKNIFNEDFLRKAAAEPDNIDLFLRMGFVMAKFAELQDRAAVNRLTQNDFLDWLDQFRSGEIVVAAADIATVFMNEAGGEVAAKKNNPEQAGK